jgi:8-oxo-dGTP pyrophosphatase MutT (NUDIX family)
VVEAPAEKHELTLPRQRVTAGALIRDADNRVLLVKPAYRSDWLTPGGSVEATESPARAAAREVFEELGLALPIGRLLVMQWCREEGEPDGVLNLTYDAGVVGVEVVDEFRLETGLSSFRFVSPEELAGLASVETAERVIAALDVLASGVVAELGR